MLNRDILLCVHFPSVWAEFLTVCEAAARGNTNVYKTYRQSFLEPLPVTIWACARWPIRYRPGSVTRQQISWSPDLGRNLPPPTAYPEPISVIIDFDCAVNPISIFKTEIFGAGSINNTKPLRLIIGHEGAVFTFRPVQMFRFPDAVDHLAFLYGLLYRLSRLKDSLSYDFAQMQEMNDKKDTIKYFHEWLMTIKFSLERGLQIEMATSDKFRIIYPPDDLDVESSLSFDTDNQATSEIDQSTKAASGLGRPRLDTSLHNVSAAPLEQPPLQSEPPRENESDAIGGFGRLLSAKSVSSLDENVSCCYIDTYFSKSRSILACHSSFLVLVINLINSS